MKRRNFIKQLGGAAALSMVDSLAIPLISGNTQRQITILHTNDTHSHIEPFDADHSRNPNRGGVARRATIIEKIRQENKNTLLLDAGDIFQGTPYFNYFGGELEFKLMSMLKYDVATIGNHDFDNSIEGLYKQLPNAKFDFVSANYDFKNTVLDTHVKPYKVIVKDDIKIGIFGLGIELEGLVGKKMYKETGYLDPIEITQDITKRLKNEENCDLIICLSHLGYYYKNNPNKISDLNLAKATKDIDLIIGGHTHTFLPKPTIVKNLDDKNILVNQVGAYGINLGRIDFYFDENKNKSANGTTILV
ncbi:bifunctional UDP-sugar hydrolase/5'-nucleotidase [uncultured Polaribacter sp.]|uniref:bifunctional metallophosphatase/5'-nucleotidase n=1 Tax=uncultured Polaribacter sp. TaxID=174711 RepID=UPI0026020D90|nr:metallophosphatase [uncultured Polaribacter sp.]